MIIFVINVVRVHAQESVLFGIGIGAKGYVGIVKGSYLRHGISSGRESIVVDINTIIGVSSLVMGREGKFDV